MKLYLYKNTSDRRKVGKDLTLVETLDNVLFKENTDILHPVFTFRKDSEENWKNFNYCMLQWGSMTKRYYFIKNIVVEPGGIISISCEVDVLETYKTYIRGLYTIVSRQEYICNKSIRDEQMIIPLNRVIDSVEFEDSVGDGGDGSIILTVSG